MNIAPFLKQTATLEARTNTANAFGDASYDAPIQIKVRKTHKSRISRKKREWKTLDETQYMTNHPVKLGDRIDGQEILDTEELRDFDGSLIGTISYPNKRTSFGDG